MGFSSTFIDLVGFISLLLWGTHMVQTGIQRAFGANLRSILGRAISNRLRAFLAGAGVTALLQSSTATGLMVTGFSAQGLIELVPGLAIMLGANVGTTLIVLAMSFNAAAAAPLLILVGFLMFRRDSSTLFHDLGRVFIGLGLMLLALQQLLELLTPYEGAPMLRMLMGAISSQLVLDVILAAIITWAMHSSVAVVLLVVSFASKGVIPPNAAFALVLGANIGSAINPVIEGAAGLDLAAKRVPIGNLLSRTAGALLLLPMLPMIGSLAVQLEPDNGRVVAYFHLAFNLALAGLLLPLLKPYARLLTQWLPESKTVADPSRPLYLDLAAKETPIVALGGAAREAMRLADHLEEMLRNIRLVLETTDRKLISQTRRHDDVLDKLNTAIKLYLSSLDPDELGPDDQRRLQEILLFATNMEQAGDVIDRTFLPHIIKRMKRGVLLSDDDRHAIVEMTDRLIANLRSAASLLFTEDLRAARLLADEKTTFRAAETKATQLHFQRLRAANTHGSQTSSLHLDLLRDLKQINSYIVAAAAYPILERSNELLSTRLAANDG